jgi:hypothetical protein
MTEGVLATVYPDPGSYNVGDVNSFIITIPTEHDNENCLGFRPRSAWGSGVYARIATNPGEDDCNLDGIPDDCQWADCNSNAVLDDCDIRGGTAEDCNGNGVPDQCDIDAQTSEDCNENGIPDECVRSEMTIYEMTYDNLVGVNIDEGCDAGPYNGTPPPGAPQCILSPGFQWTDASSVPVRDVQIEFGVGVECSTGTIRATTLNGIVGPSYASTPTDCECHMIDGVLVHLHADRESYNAGGSNTFRITIPTEHDNENCLGFRPRAAWESDVYARVIVNDGREEDCNDNGAPDDCDIAAGTSSDDNSNGVPDECEAEAIPTLSTWSLVAMTLLMLTAGSVVCARRLAGARYDTEYRSS